MICQEKKKCFKVCAQCHEKYCVACFNKIHTNSLNPCPYCRYDFIEHGSHNFEDKLKHIEGGDCRPLYHF